jgi:hypothetical protein
MSTNVSQVIAILNGISISAVLLRRNRQYPTSGPRRRAYTAARAELSIDAKTQRRREKNLKDLRGALVIQRLLVISGALPNLNSVLALLCDSASLR